MENYMSEQAQATSEENTAPKGLSISDLLLMYQTLQVVVARGAIKAEELSTVGGLHDRLLDFLEKSGVIKKSVPDNTETESSTEEKSND
jgi:hypothetical protein